MKKVLLSFLFAIVGGFVFAQTQLTGSQSQEVMSTLTQTAASMQTMQCRFVQTKTMAMLAEPSVSEGTMAYVTPDKMRWEYVQPYSFALIVKGEQIIRITDGKAETIDPKQGRMYKGMSDLIMGSASGKKLFDTSVFDVKMFDDGEMWLAEMEPLRKDMKRMFAKLVFRFSKKTNVISSVDFIEPKGDVTSIRFEELRVNETIDESVFKE